MTPLRTKASWQRHLHETGKTLETYCAAQQNVETWMSRVEPTAKRDALAALMTAVSNGTPFDAAFAQ